MSKYEEYLICNKRGHTADPLRGTVSNTVYGALTWSTCRYCGAEFTTKTTHEQLERNIPNPSPNQNQQQEEN